jgi:hypothetical protein
MRINQNRNALIAASAILIAALMCIGAAKTPESAEIRLQRLEDRESIRRLLMDYGRFLDQRDFGAFSKLFAEKEGEWVGGMGKAKGPDAIRTLMEKTIGADASMKNANLHIFTNEIIKLDGDRASATTKWMFVIKGESNRPQPIYLGHYEDALVRENGNWKFLKRMVYADIPPDDAIPSK